jgi:cyclic pyranopterin phosphate synthase
MPPEGVPLSPPSHLLTNDEISQLVDLFVKHGVNKVRLTGGEPLLRPNLVPLVKSISDSLLMSQQRDTHYESSGLVGITTNGISLSRHVKDLVDAGLTGVNISLDTLREDRFVEITRRKGLQKVLRSIQDSIDVFKDRFGGVRVGDGGSRVKINCVVMKNFNDDELCDFVHAANETFQGDVDMRFIEWMPFNDNGWNRSRFVSYKDMITKVTAGGDGNVQLERIGDGPNDTTKWWTVQSETKTASRARIGFITSMSEHFCASCNRLRITADGKIKVCLFGSNEKEVSLRDIMRHRSSENVDCNEDLSQVIYAAVQKKSFSLGGHDNPDDIATAADNRPMTLIGG